MVSARGPGIAVATEIRIDAKNATEATKVFGLNWVILFAYLAASFKRKLVARVRLWPGEFVQASRKGIFVKIAMCQDIVITRC
jgi:hypothetical protein